MKEYQFRVVGQRVPLGKRVQFYIADYSGKYPSYCKETNLVFETTDEETTEIYDPSLVLPEPLCQELFDELWRLGFRPLYASTTGPEIDAVKEALKDARQVRDKILDSYIKKTEGDE